MPEHTPHQKRIIDGYYARRDEIMLARVGDIVSELYLAETDAQRRKLWNRADKAMQALGIAQDLRDHVLREQKPDLLAAHLRDWLNSAKKQA